MVVGSVILRASLTIGTSAMEVEAGADVLPCLLLFFFIKTSLSDLVISMDFFVGIVSNIGTVVIGCILRGGSAIREEFGGVLIGISVIKMISVFEFSSVISRRIGTVIEGGCELDASKPSGLKIDKPCL